MNETVLPLIEQTPALPAAIEKETASPELAFAVTVYGEPPTAAGDGAVDVNVIVCELFDGVETVNDCCTRVAAAKLALPAWSAFTVQVPAPVKDTVAAEIEQTLALPAAIENETARPDVAVAVTV